jgi:acyl carrier protein
MNEADVMERVVKILTPRVKNEEALASVSKETNILDDLKVNSARLVDVVIAFEDEFDIEIADEDVDTVNAVGDAVSLILSKLGRTFRGGVCRPAGFTSDVNPQPSNWLGPEQECFPEGAFMGRSSA